jgi:hypothetical protein
MTKARKRGLALVEAAARLILAEVLEEVAG